MIWATQDMLIRRWDCIFVSADQADLSFTGLYQAYKNPRSPLQLYHRSSCSSQIYDSETSISTFGVVADPYQSDMESQAKTVSFLHLHPKSAIKFTLTCSARHEAYSWTNWDDRHWQRRVGKFSTKLCHCFSPAITLNFTLADPLLAKMAICCCDPGPGCSYRMPDHIWRKYWALMCTQLYATVNGMVSLHWPESECLDMARYILNSMSAGC